MRTRHVAQSCDLTGRHVVGLLVEAIGLTHDGHQYQQLALSEAEGHDGFQERICNPDVAVFDLGTVLISCHQCHCAQGASLKKGETSIDVTQSRDLIELNNDTTGTRMEDTFESLELQMQVAVYRLAIDAIFSTLSPTQRNVAIASFKALSEKNHSRIDDGKTHPKAIEFYKKSCAKVMKEMEIQ